MPKRGDEVVDIACEVLIETAAAYRITDGGVTVWVPKSQVELERDHATGGAICTMPTWLAKEKALI